MIEWLWPYFFLLLPVPWLVRRFCSTQERAQAALQVPNLNVFSEVAVETPRENQSTRLRLILLWLVWVCLIFAVARPQWTGEPVTLPTSGRDLMLAVDISGSMATEDMEIQGKLIDRLSVVKAVVSNFVEERKGDRIGLVLFGTNAYLQAPLTFDTKSVNRLLIEAPVGIAGGKTAIGDAIGLAVKRLRVRPGDEKVLILLTDGANNVGEIAPEKAAELAASDHIKIYTIGVGADEMRMPSLGFLGSRITNPSADLDEETLTRVARATGGKYFRARDTQGLEQIYAEIDELEPIEQDPETYRPIQALFFWPLAAAGILFAMLLLQDILPQPRRTQSTRNKTANTSLPGSQHGI